MRLMDTAPPSLPRRRMVAGLPAWVGVGVVAHAQPVQPDLLPPPRTEAPPARVTSDSAEFCAQLADEVRGEERARQSLPLPAEVRTLGQEGEKMCTEGRLRPGILRLRRALQILREE